MGLPPIASEAWWVALYEESLDSIYRWVYCRVGSNHAEAEDIVQDVYLQAFRKRRYYDPDRATPVQWLIGFARKELAGRRRSHAIASRALKSRLERMDRDLIPEDVLERKEFEEAIGAALNDLPQHYAHVLLQKYKEDKTVAQIAEESKASSKTVESLLTRARLAFQKLFSE